MKGNAIHSKKWKMNNLEKVRDYNRRYYLANRNRIIKRGIERASKNKDKINTYNRIYRKKKRDMDVGYRIGLNLRIRLWKLLKGVHNSNIVLRNLGCSIEGLKKHLEYMFKEDMSWDNYGKVWEIDHIKPFASFDLQNKEHLKEVLHYSNLRPLHCSINRSNGGKLRNKNYKLTSLFKNYV